MSGKHEGIEPQFDLAAQEARADAAARARLAQNAATLNGLADELEAEGQKALEAERALDEMPEAGKVEQEPELFQDIPGMPPSTPSAEVQGG